MKKNYLLILLVVLLLVGCQKKPSVEGLWTVKRVTVGEKEMTPNARWMRFNADFTQQSGNGWFQHSFGTWKFNSEKHELSVVNTNGITDPSGPFNVSFSENKMVWKRQEDGQTVEVHLERANQLPATFGDELLGLWKLEKAVGNGAYFSASPEPSDYLFFRWDRIFVMKTSNNRIDGVYQVHGHKPEVELIPYNEQLKRSIWEIQFGTDSITLKLLNTDSIVTRTYKRIHEFPNE